jgi:hypothetical protein
MASLLDLQRKQKSHDESFHRDIYFLSHQERFKHIAYHFGKYTGRIARMLKTLDSADKIDIQLRKTLTDSFIIILNAAEIFGLDLDYNVAKALGLNKPSRNDVKKLAGLFRESNPAPYPNLVHTNDNDLGKLILNLLLEYADAAQILHKACDSLDHMEGLDREKITSSLVNLLTIVVLAGDSIGLDFEDSVPKRWREIEQSKVL